jgi:hypothetical protein
MLNPHALVARLMVIKAFVRFIFLFLVFSSCQSRGYEEYHRQAEASTYSLLLVLKKINTRQDLIEQKYVLKNIFSELAELSIKSKEYQIRHDKEKAAFSFKKNQYSEELRVEMTRVYNLPDGRKIMEACQQEGLSNLDRFQKKSALNN